MKPHNEDRDMSGAADKPKKPRFRIEKLEERIAPHHRSGHYPPGQICPYGQCCPKGGNPKTWGCDN